MQREAVEQGGRDLVAIWVPVITHMMLPYSRHKDLMESYEEHRAIVVALSAGDAKTALERLWTNIQ
jgi:DNA-binding GntR family transcriptional regulator